MLQTKTQREKMDAYCAKYLVNKQVEWLIECGKIRQNVYFKGATGDRYTIYIATKRNNNIIDFHSIYNDFGYGTTDGTHIATIKNYVLRMVGAGGFYWHNSCGFVIKQLMRQGIEPKSMDKQWKIRYCRSAFFMRLADSTQFNPWIGMKLDLKTGKLINNPNKVSIKAYSEARTTDKKQRKQNRIANKNNAEALTRYHKADGNFALLPMEDIFKHRNVEYRTDILNFYGLEKVLVTLDTKVEDEDTIDGRFYRLINVHVPDYASGNDRHQWCLYLEMINPSTGESHFEGIANVGSANWGSGSIEEATVKAALSWRDGDGQIQQGNQNWNAKSTSDNYVTPIKLT